MAERTLGWIQNPSNTKTLRNIVSIFNPDSQFTGFLLNTRIPFIRSLGKLHDEEEWDTYIERLKSGLRFPYNMLKGKGAGGGSRADAPCSGIIQAAIEAQKYLNFSTDPPSERIKKPYSDDWTADGFLRWAISLGFIDYDAETDTCSVTDLGIRFSEATETDEFNDILGEAYLHYPPACRVLNLLLEGNQLTKFEIGRHLGFTTEAGFTSFPQNLFVQAIVENPEIKNTIKSNYEGSSDKYARMICGWLCEIGWVVKSGKKVTEIAGGREYSTFLDAFSITAIGRKEFKRSIGASSVRQIPKIVYLEMLSTKSEDRNYLRRRRAEILSYIQGHFRTDDEIISHLKSKGFKEDGSAIAEDLRGFVNIGLNISKSSKGTRLNDKIICLRIPQQKSVDPKSEVLQIKERVRPYLKNLDMDYLKLIDLAYDGSANLKFEITTIDLLTNELQFNGKHLGGSRKPDGIIHYNNRGIIIDNKAYSKGYTLPRAQVDEMARYIRENQNRNQEINPNKWWSEFPDSTHTFYFAFISSFFTGMYKDRLAEISKEYHLNGATIDVENLLYIAEGLKSGKLSYEHFFELFNNDRIVYTC